MIESRESWPKPMNIMELATENADISIVYSNHTIVSNPEAAKNVDAIILELIEDYQTPELASQTAHLISPRGVYGEIIRLAAEQQKPVFLVDISAENYDSKSFHRSMILPIIEALVASGLVYSTINQQKHTRRDFLTLGAKTATATYLGIPEMHELAGAVSTNIYTQEPREGSATREAERMLGQLKNNTHPETHSLTDTRNDLMAEKTEYIGRMIKTELGRKPALSLFIGSKHIGIEDSLKSDQTQRIKRLRTDLGTKLVQERFIAKFIFEPKVEGTPQKFSVSIIEDPDLN